MHFIYSSLESALRIRNIERFSLALTIEALQAEICRRERFLKGGSLWSPILGGRGRRPPVTVGGRKLEGLPFHAA